MRSEIVEKFLFVPADNHSSSTHFLIYPYYQGSDEKIADLYFSESGQPRLAVSGEAIFNYLRETTTKSIDVEVPHTFVVSALAQEVDSHLSDLMHAVSTFVQNKAPKFGFLFRVVIWIPLSDKLKVTGRYTDAWRQALAPTAKNVDYSLDFADDSLRAEMHFEDSVITSSQLRVLRFFADIVKFMLSGEGTKKLYQKFDSLNSLLDGATSGPRTLCDEESWLIYDISEVTKK